MDLHEFGGVGIFRDRSLHSFVGPLLCRFPHCPDAPKADNGNRNPCDGNNQSYSRQKSCERRQQNGYPILVAHAGHDRRRLLDCVGNHEGDGRRKYTPI